jgi:hypothetical protein
MSASSDNKDSTRLVWTIVGAALGGAAVSFVSMKYYEQRKELMKHREALRRSRHQPSFPSSTTIPKSDSIIFPHNHEEKMRRRIAARVAVEEDNLTPRNSVTVRVPATSANLGPGCTYKQLKWCNCQSSILFLYNSLHFTSFSHFTL